MTGETDLKKLLQGMKPNLNNGEFVFCTFADYHPPPNLDPVCYFREQEGMTLILSREQAGEESISYTNIFSWITLTVHSSLEAVGLTAAVATALADSNISCNVVAAYFHDHIFVPVKDSKRAMEILENLSGGEAE